MTGGVCRTGQHVCHPVEAVAAGQIDLQHGIHAVIVLQLLHFHGGGIVQQDDDLAAVCLLCLDCGVDQGALVIGQTQRIGLVQVLAGIHACLAGHIAAVLTSCTGNGDDHDVVIVHAVLPAGICRVHCCLRRLLAGEVAGGGGSNDAVVSLGAAPGLDLRLEALLHGSRGVHLLQGGVDGVALCGKCAHKVDGIGIGALIDCETGAHVTALYREVAGEAQQAHLAHLVRAQGQRAVVLQQDGAFLIHPLAQILNCLEQLGGGAVVGLIGVQIHAIGGFGHQLRALGAQKLVDVGPESVHDGLGTDAQRQNGCQNGGRAAPCAATGISILHGCPP